MPSLEELLTAENVVTWLIVGSIVGSFLGMLLNRKKEGFGRFTNLAIGLIGAIVGMVFLNVFNVFAQLKVNLRQYKITLEDLVAALFGSLLFLVVVWIIKKLTARSKKG